MKKTKKVFSIVLVLSIFLLSSCNKEENGEKSFEQSIFLSDEDDVSKKETSNNENLIEESFDGDDLSGMISNRHLTLEECQIVIERTGGYSKKSEFYQNAINSEKLKQESLALPIYKMESVNDVDRIKEILAKSYQSGEADCENLVFKKVVENTDEEFFKSTTIYLTYFLSGTGSYRYSVTNLDENGIFTVAQNEYPYDIVTDDEAGWFFFIFAPKEKADKLASVDAVYSPVSFGENS